MTDEIKEGDTVKLEKKKGKKEITMTKQPAPDMNNPMALIAQAVDKKVDVATMEKLMDLQERWQKGEAKKAFDRSMAAFQSECPAINKTVTVKNKDGSARYKFAPLDAIIEQVKSILQKHGFSYTIDVKYENNIMLSTCKITHELGHSETSTFPAPIDPQGFMNEAQKFASASTFAKRYAFCNAFGIMTADMDDDSQESGTALQDANIAASMEMIKNAKSVQSLQDYKVKVMAYKSFTETQKSSLVDAVDNKIEELTHPK